MSGLQTSTRRAVRSSAPRLANVPSTHVLVADGNPESRAIRAAQLDAAGFRVSVARTAFEAIVKASCHVPDVILVDNSLADGEIDVSEIDRLLTTCPVTAHIPVVRLTSRGRVPQRLVSELRRHATAAPI